ncbi:MAG: PQQ-dependent sugar dehydrogenase [Gammaproteobacteria bacterium]|nr:PQQ-dependent sugar dehydrogenase [Gammaproteobacteria bacterium]
MKHSRSEQRGPFVGSAESFVLSAALLIGAAAATAPAGAQQSVPFQFGIPVAPQGLADKPLGEGPFEYPTAEGMDIRVTIVTKELEFPYALEFLPDGTLLVTERAGRLRAIRDGKLEPEPVAGGPEAFSAGESGLPGAVHGYMNLALHPQYDDNRRIYMSYTKPLADDRTTVAIGSGTWDGEALQDFTDVFVLDEGTGGATPIIFGQDGKLYVATSGGDAQDPSSHGGKVLRLNDDGSVPQDNPFVGKDGYKPEIYTLGHRSSLGLAVHPTSGDIWQSENGPNGGDELNVIRAGRNYGWPIVSLGRTYPGPWQNEKNIPTHDGYEAPVVYWTPAIAVSGLTFYTGSELAAWTGDIFVGGLRYGEIPGTGRLDRVLVNENMEELRRESLLLDLRQRIRDVAQGPDGLLYVVTDEDEGAVLRIEPIR